MCRFIAYLGHPLILNDVLYKPQNSLIKQSIHSHDVSVPLNGDGFGLGWYNLTLDKTPAVYKSIQPAWNDQNLQNLSTKIRAESFFAHVRAASSGNVSYANTHPFYYKNIMFMHNGDLGDFIKYKRILRRTLSDEIYNLIQGQTDSEHFFGLFLDLMMQSKLKFNAKNAAHILTKTISKIEAFRKEVHAKEKCYINAVISNGITMVAIRYVSSGHKSIPSLYYSKGNRYEFVNGVSHMTPTNGTRNGAILIASEKLTYHRCEWIKVPANSMLLIHEDRTDEIHKLRKSDLR